MNNSTIETYTGTAFNVTAPTLDDISIVDIAHSLSLLCRFGGHTEHLYTVGQHSLNVMRVIEAAGFDERVQLKALLHDATEAYMIDLPRPIKVLMPEYKELENRVAAVIYERFGLSDVGHDELIKAADDAVLGYEAVHLMPCEIWNPQSDEWLDSLMLDVSERKPGDVEREFMDELLRLVEHSDKQQGRTVWNG